VLTLLFKTGTMADSDSEDDTRRALLWSAVEKDHKAVVRLLLLS